MRAADRLVARQARELARERHEGRGGHARRCGSPAPACSRGGGAPRAAPSSGRGRRPSCVPRSGVQEAEERLQQRRLAGPVRAEEAGRPGPERARDARRAPGRGRRRRARSSNSTSGAPSVTHCLDSTSLARLRFHSPAGVPASGTPPAGSSLEPQDGLAARRDVRANARRRPGRAPHGMRMSGRSTSAPVGRSASGGRPVDLQRSLPAPPSRDPIELARRGRAGRAARPRPGRGPPRPRARDAPRSRRRRGRRRRPASSPRASVGRAARAVRRASARARRPASEQRPPRRAASARSGERAGSCPASRGHALSQSDRAAASEPGGDARPEPRRARPPRADEEVGDVLVPVGVRALREQQAESLAACGSRHSATAKSAVHAASTSDERDGAAPRSSTCARARFADERRRASGATGMK